MPLTSALMRVCLISLCVHGAVHARTEAPAEAEQNKSRAELWDEGTERQRAWADEFLGDTREMGMALLVIPTINLDAQGPRNFDDPSVRADFVRQRSMKMRWLHHVNEHNAISVGYGKHKREAWDTGPLFQMTDGAITYQMIAVQPGRYRLARITYIQPGMREPAPHDKPASLSLDKAGVAVLNEFDMKDYRKTGHWSQAMKRDDGMGTGCPLVLRVGDGCTEEAREFRWGMSARSAVKGGVAEVIEIPAIDAELTFSPVAEITLAEGDVVLTDGFVLPADQPKLAEDTCQVLANDLMCSLDTLTVERLPASLKSFRQATGLKAYGMTKTEAALRNLVYRAPKIHAKPVPGASPNLLRVE